MKFENSVGRAADVATGVLACRGGRASRRPEKTMESGCSSETFQHHDRSFTDPPGGTPQLHGRWDARRYDAEGIKKGRHRSAALKFESVDRFIILPAGSIAPNR